MPYVVTENCRSCRFTECVTVCPCDCFYGDAEMLYIDPDACIDCGACAPVCPVEAIHFDADLPPDLAGWAARNRERAQSGELPNMTAPEPPLPGADARRAALGY